MALTSLAWARPQGRTLRARRYSHSRGSRGHHQNQLMRVGCVLGTCQVQNLSHRLYQLIGQSGREDSSPMNPQSPHSYGWVRWPLFVCQSFIFLYLMYLSLCYSWLLHFVSCSQCIYLWMSSIWQPLCTFSHLIYLWLIHLHQPKFLKH